MAKMTGFKVYKGTKQAFIESGKATANADAIVFITGGADGNKGSCIFAQGAYFGSIAELMGAINYVKGVKVGTSNYDASTGGGYIPFAAADNSTVALNVSNGTITVGLTDAFVTKVNDTATNLGTKDDAANKDGSAFARIANLAALVSDLTGGSTDSIEGQINAAIDSLRTEILGTLADDDSKTLEAINDELNTIDNSIIGLGNRVNNEAPVTIAETAGTGDVLKTYTFTQNGKEIGKINLAKDLVVTGGDIVEIDGVKNLQLTIANQANPVNIPVSDLVDAYTAKANATEVQVAISDTNEVSATLVDGGITTTKIKDNAVTTAKIEDGNVTLAKLGTDVKDKLAYTVDYSQSYIDSSVYDSIVASKKALMVVTTGTIVPATIIDGGFLTLEAVHGNTKYSMSINRTPSTGTHSVTKSTIDYIKDSDIKIADTNDKFTATTVDGALDELHNMWNWEEL